MVVKWNKSAIRDLHKIYLYIADHSPYYAKKVVSDILDMSEYLSRFPKQGKTVDGASRPETRELQIYSYRMIYRVHKQTVRILLLAHSRQNLPLLHL